MTEQSKRESLAKIRGALCRHCSFLADNCSAVTMEKRVRAAREFLERSNPAPETLAEQIRIQKLEVKNAARKLSALQKQLAQTPPSPDSLIWQSRIVPDTPVTIDYRIPGGPFSYIFKPKTDYILRIEDGVFTLKEGQCK